MAVNKVIYNNDGTPNVLIDLTGDTATASDVAQGKTFHLANGTQATGTASGVSIPYVDNVKYTIDSSSLRTLAPTNVKLYNNTGTWSMPQQYISSGTKYFPSTSLAVGDQLTATRSIMIGTSDYYFSNASSTASSSSSSWDSISYRYRDYVFYLTKANVLQVTYSSTTYPDVNAVIYLVDYDTGIILQKGNSNSLIDVSGINNKLIQLIIVPYGANKIETNKTALLIYYSEN